MPHFYLKENLFPDLAVIDVEASGLDDGTYPIEIAWSFGNLRTKGFLIRPLPGWGEEDWYEESERIHKIPRSRLFKEGVDAVEVARRMNDDLSGMHLLSDAPAWDGYWIGRLFEDTGVEPEFIFGNLCSELGPLATRVSELEFDRIERLVKKIFPDTHRAHDDARSRMAFLCALQKPELIDEWLARIQREARYLSSRADPV